MSLVTMLSIAAWVLTLVSALAIGSLRREPAGGQPDLVLHNGAVYTVDSARPWAAAIAIEGGQITAVGSDENVLALTGADTKTLDLGGRMIMPGLHDPHLHDQPPGLVPVVMLVQQGIGVVWIE